MIAPFPSCNRPHHTLLSPTGIANFVAPILMATVYDSFITSDGDVRGKATLAITVSISCVATLTYAPIMFLLRSEPKPPTLTDEQYHKFAEGM